MIIQSVEVENFRGIHKTKKFHLENKKFILLSAENGIGKTTLIDAIEWCLTGNIGRLRTAYDFRSTNHEERKMNLDGILKNRNAKNEDSVRVSLEVEQEGNEYIITREQKSDELNAEKSTLTIEDKQHRNPTNSVLEAINDKNFYNYHFCDVQKSFNIQSTQRGKLSDLFSDFISDYQKEKRIAQNLRLFEDDTDRKIKDNVKKIEDFSNKISERNEQLNKLLEQASFLEYNPTLLFEGEQVALLKLSIEELNQQIEKLYYCGYQQAYEKLGTLIENHENEKVLSLLKKLTPILIENGEKVKEAVTLKLDDTDNLLIEIQKKYNQYKEKRMTFENYEELAEDVISFGDSKFNRSYYTQAKNDVKLVCDQIKLLEEELAVLNNGNEIVQTLSSLVSRKQDIISFREELTTNGKAVKCPVCGSEQFGIIQDTAILEEAEKYLQENDKIITDKKILRSELGKQKKDKIQEIINKGNAVLQQENSKNERELERLRNLKKETQSFFDIAIEFSVLGAKNFSNEALQNLDWVSGQQTKYQSKIIDEVSLKQIQKEIEDIFKIVGYEQKEDKTEEATKLRIAEYVQSAPVIKQFSISLWIEKINAIKSIKKNSEYTKGKREVQEWEKQQKALEDTNQTMQERKEKASKRAEDIINVVEQLKKAEYNSVGPYLFQFYKKLARVNNIQNIEVSIDGDKISLKDESGKNIVNVLSNGQLSIFMLSYFFGGIVSRGNAERCKIYFIDDLTACMDDINMLNFLDTLKYQLTSSNFMEQVFFASCDDRICRLIKYKLEGCGIEYKELSEEQFLA